MPITEMTVISHIAFLFVDTLPRFYGLWGKTPVSGGMMTDAKHEENINDIKLCWQVFIEAITVCLVCRRNK